MNRLEAIKRGDRGQCRQWRHAAFILKDAENSQDGGWALEENGVKGFRLDLPFVYDGAPLWLAWQSATTVKEPRLQPHFQSSVRPIGSIQEVFSVC